MAFLPMDEEQEEYSFEKFLYERMKEDSEQESDEESEADEDGQETSAQ